MKNHEELRQMLAEPFKNLLSTIEEDLYKAKEEGDQEGYQRGLEEDISDWYKEKIQVNFVVEKFKECKTLEEFQDAYKWIENRSFNFI